MLKTNEEWLLWQKEMKCNDYIMEICKNQELIVEYLDKILLMDKGLVKKQEKLKLHIMRDNHLRYFSEIILNVEKRYEKEIVIPVIDKEGIRDIIINPKIDKEYIKRVAIDKCQILYNELNKISEVSFFISRKAIQIKILIEKLE